MSHTDDRATTDAPSQETDPAHESAGDARAHLGPRPRLRRLGRSLGILAVLAFIVLLTILSSRYSHRIGPADAAQRDAPATLTLPLSTERIEDLARRQLEERLRAAEPAPPSPFASTAETSPTQPVEPTAPPSYRPAAQSSTRAPATPPPSSLPALRSSLSPAAVSRPSATSPPPTDPAALPSWERLLSPSPADQALRRAEPPAPPDTASQSPPAQRPAVDLPSPNAQALHRSPPPTGPILYGGTRIPLVLTHEVSTEVAGPVRAFVAHDVLDSFRRDRVLIPRGTLVLGHQAAHATSGDRRILIAWTQLRLPSGASYELPQLPAGSSDGTAGALGNVDSHWWSRFGSAIGLSLVGAGVQLSQAQDRSPTGSLAVSDRELVAEQLGLELGRLSQEILRRGLNRPPTIHLEAGAPLSLLVPFDLTFPAPQDR